MGIREIQVEARAAGGHVMAGGGGAAGPTPDVRHQPPGDMACTVPQISFKYQPELLKSTDVLTHIAKRLDHTDTMHEVVSSNPIIMQKNSICFVPIHTSMCWYIPVYTFNVTVHESTYQYVQVYTKSEVFIPCYSICWYRILDRW